MVDAWLDKLEEVSQLLDEIVIDVQEKERLTRQGHSTDRIATRISRDASKLESGLHTLEAGLNKLPLSIQDKSHRERMLGQLMQKFSNMQGAATSRPVNH